jgi:hypothetical protein
MTGADNGGPAKSEDEKLARAMAIVEAAVQTMAEEGLSPMMRVLGLAFHMNAQADLAIPNANLRRSFKYLVLTDEQSTGGAA